MESLSGSLIAAILTLALPGARAHTPAPPAPPAPPATGSDPRPAQAAAELPPIDALLERLANAQDAELQPLLLEAWDAFRVEEGAYRLERAEALARAMHERARAQWSALSLALLSSRLGKAEVAEAVLAEQYRRTSVPAERVELLERRAIAAMGAGERRRALDLLGHALILGGRDAQQMLGRDALARMDYEGARLLFAPLLPAIEAGKAPYEAGQVPAWALRGWGLALLGARADPVGPSVTR